MTFSCPKRLGFVVRSKATSLAPVVQKMDNSAIHWIIAILWIGVTGKPIALYPVDREFYLMDSVINLLTKWGVNDIRSQLANQFQTIQYPIYERYLLSFGSKDASA